MIESRFIHEQNEKMDSELKKARLTSVKTSGAGGRRSSRSIVSSSGVGHGLDLELSESVSNPLNAAPILESETAELFNLQQT